MHTSHGIGHTIGSRTCCHVVRVQSTTCTAAGSNREVLLALFDAFLLVSTSYRMLETCRVGGVTSDGNVYAFLPHDCNAFGNVICTVAVYLCTGAVCVLGVALAEYFLDFAGVVVHFGFYISEAVYTCDDLCSVLAQTVQDNTQRFLTNLVCLFSDTDRTFCGSEGFVTCQKCEALGVFFQQHLAQITVAQTNLSLVSNRTRNAECLQTFTDCSSSVSSSAAALLDRNCCTNGISPLCVFEADRLNAFYHLIYVQTSSLGNFSCTFDGINAIFLQNSQNLLFSSLI